MQSGRSLRSCESRIETTWNQTESVSPTIQKLRSADSTREDVIPGDDRNLQPHRQTIECNAAGDLRPGLTPRGGRSVAEGAVIAVAPTIRVMGRCQRTRLKPPRPDHRQ